MSFSLNVKRIKTLEEIFNHFGHVFEIEFEIQWSKRKWVGITNELIKIIFSLGIEDLYISFELSIKLCQ